MYDVVVLIHILSATVWVGGGFLQLVVIRRTHRRDGQEAADGLLRQLEWVDTWIFTPAPLLVIATGITMVVTSRAWAFSQAWIYLALTLMTIEFVGMDPLVRPVLKRIRTAQTEGTVSAPEYGVALRRYLSIGTVAMSFLVVVVVLMVFKPGV